MLNIIWSHTDVMRVKNTRYLLSLVSLVGNATERCYVMYQAL